MLSPAAFHASLAEEGISFFAGVPDSLLKDLCAYIADAAAPGQHVIAANEGAAVALAAGYHLATGGIGAVYLQNSGLGNTVNPLTSLVDPEVYAIPVLLIIGWRGEPGVHDEPQHVKQGRVTRPTLDTLEVAHAVLPSDEAEARETLRHAVAHCRSTSAPFALVVRKGTFAEYKLRTKAANAATMTREEAIIAVLESLGDDAVVVSTTGMASREVYEYRARSGAGHGRDFLTVGCMGHASQIALGIAMARPDRRVVCLDGDGATLMHMGSLAIVAQQAPRNYTHVVLNNGAHDSVGAQPTAGLAIDIPAIARASGYPRAERVDSREAIGPALRAAAGATGPSLVEVMVRTGSRADLGRPKTTPAQNKAEFMTLLGGRS